MLRYWQKEVSLMLRSENTENSLQPDFSHRYGLLKLPRTHSFFLNYSINAVITENLRLISICNSGT